MPPATLPTVATGWPRPRIASNSAAGKPASISNWWPWVQTRGASTASCTLMPWSIRLTSAWKTEGKIRSPPGSPSAQTGLPSRSTITGDIDDVIRLPASTELARPGRGSKTYM